MRKWAFGNMQTAKFQASLWFRTVLPEPLLFAFSLSRSTACKSKQQSFLQDCVDAQACLKLCCLPMSEGPFSHDMAYYLNDPVENACPTLSAIFVSALSNFMLRPGASVSADTALVFINAHQWMKEQLCLNNNLQLPLFSSSQHHKFWVQKG